MEQHFVNKGYLSAWCDPSTPKGYEPYVYVFPKEGGKSKKRAPKNIFKESNFYTISRPDGEKDLRIEKGLSGLEAFFSNLRKEKLEKIKPIPLVAGIKLLAFAATMTVRTKKMRDHHGKFWGETKGLMDEVLENTRALPSDERRKLSKGLGRTKRNKDTSLSYEQVKSFAEQPMQSFLMKTVPTILNGYHAMRASIVTTKDETEFITSDHPVVWFDPMGYKKPPIYRAPGLGDETLEVTMPISPRLCLFLTHGEPGWFYLEGNERLVLEVNRRTRYYSEEKIVNCKDFFDPDWLDVGKAPEN